MAQLQQIQSDLPRSPQPRIHPIRRGLHASPTPFLRPGHTHGRSQGFLLQVDNIHVWNTT